MLLNFMAGNPAFSYRQMFGILSSIRWAMGASSAGPLLQMVPAQSRKRCSDQLVVSISRRLSIALYRLTSSLRRVRLLQRILLARQDFFARRQYDLHLVRHG